MTTIRTDDARVMSITNYNLTMQLEAILLESHQLDDLSLKEIYDMLAATFGFPEGERQARLLDKLEFWRLARKQAAVLLEVQFRDGKRSHQAMVAGKLLREIAKRSERPESKDLVDEDNPGGFYKRDTAHMPNNLQLVKVLGEFVYNEAANDRAYDRQVMELTEEVARHLNYGETEDRMPLAVKVELYQLTFVSLFSELIKRHNQRVAAYTLLSAKIAFGEVHDIVNSLGGVEPVERDFWKGK